MAHLQGILLAQFFELGGIGRSPCEEDEEEQEAK